MAGFAEFIRFTSMGGLDFRSLYHNKGTLERWPYFEAAIRLPPGHVADVFPISQLPLHKISPLPRMARKATKKWSANNDLRVVFREI